MFRSDGFSIKNYSIHCFFSLSFFTCDTMGYVTSSRDRQTAATSVTCRLLKQAAHHQTRMMTTRQRFHLHRHPSSRTPNRYSGQQHLLSYLLQRRILTDVCGNQGSGQFALRYQSVSNRALFSPFPIVSFLCMSVNHRRLCRQHLEAAASWLKST